MKGTPRERFEAKRVIEPNGCWRWSTRRRFGHQEFFFNNKSHRDYKASWLIYRGEIPEGMRVLHNCNNLYCVNPNHLYLGPGKRNGRHVKWTLKSYKTEFESCYVIEPSGCWRWIGCVYDGVGMFYYNSKLQRANRVSWLLYKGELPKGTHIAHKCNNKWCINPDHLCLRSSTESIRKRFEAKFVKEPSGCWRWTPRSAWFGFNSKKVVKAARASWLLYRGAIPKGTIVQQTCSNSECVNPEHLRLGAAPKPKAPTYMVKLRKRFEAKYVVEPSGCWKWTAHTQNGYGSINYHYKQRGAHRISWMLHRGEIPRDKWVLHKCNNKLCVNPDHLYLGNAQDNAGDRLMSKT